MSARAANPRAKYGRGVGAEVISMARGFDKISCTYPMDFNPWILYAKLRIRILHL